MSTATTYTSFDLRPPPTPADEYDGSEEERTRHGGWLSSWLGRKRAAQKDEERSVGAKSGQATASGGVAGAGRGMVERGESTPLLAGQREGERHEQDGLPKLSRACLVAEIKCYGFVSLLPVRSEVEPS